MALPVAGVGPLTGAPDLPQGSAAPRDRPSALRPKYLAAVGTVLVALLAALAFNELRAARSLIADAMDAGASLLVEAVARAGQNAIRSDAWMEQATAQRLLGHARLLRELDRAGALPDSSLSRLADAARLYRIHVFDARGRQVATSDPHGPDDASGPAPPGIAPLLAGDDEVVLGFHEGRFHPGARYAAGVRRVGGGAILVSIDAADMLAFRRAAGIGRLMQEIGDRDDIAYLVLQDHRGVVLASRGVTGMTRIAGDAFLEAALAGDGPRSRWVEGQAKDLFESVLPFWVDEENRGLIRLGLVADTIAVAEARSRRRLAVWAGLLAVVGMALVAIISVRQNYALLDEAHTRIQTTSSRLLEDMADVVVAFDAAGRIALWNRAASDLFDLQAATALGGRIEDLGEVGRLLRDAVGAGRELRGEACRSRLPSGRSVDLSLSVSLLSGPDDELEMAVAVIQDLTERRALEADLRRRERLSAMGELASGVAHEVRNPLNAIAVIAQRLQREFVPTRDAEEYTQLTGTVRDEVARVNDIVRQFLQLARPPALQPVDTDLAALLADVAHLVRHEASGRGVAIVEDLQAAGSARVDGTQLRQAVLNLLGNAIDAVAPAQADARPSGKGTGTRRGTVRLSAQRREGGVTITVADDGPGIAPDARDRIFDLYYTTKPTGTGLGLALVQRVVAEHGGHLDVDSDVGRGATFSIHLPTESGLDT